MFTENQSFVIQLMELNRRNSNSNQGPHFLNLMPLDSLVFHPKEVKRECNYDD